MKAELNWLDNPEIFRVNQIPAHSDHMWYENDVWPMQSLSGTWKFQYSENAKSRPENFYETGYDFGTFDDIEVPGHIELAGYDKLHYINTMYPWEGHYYRRPAGTCGSDGKGLFSEVDYNPVGSYVKEFDLDESLKGKRISIYFEGVEQAMYVWLNGNFIGYAEDTFTPSEFDLTPYIKETGNVLAVEVHKRSSAAFLEDQDFFRFFGIFRDVKLLGKPAVHVDDLWIKPVLDVKNSTGTLEIDLKFSWTEAPGKVKATMYDKDGQVCYQAEAQIDEKVVLAETEVGKVVVWDNDNPYLYTVSVEVYNADGQLMEVVPYNVGFRRIEIIDKVIYFNGRRLIINGVNRHEWNAERGRSITQADMDWDMECFKRNNINAVRTCHYPNQIPWYYMCDENGISMMAEANLESHGSWQKMGAIEPSYNVPGSHAEWKEVILDRMRTNFETFKNHTAIVFWSLGNESFAGTVLEEAHNFYKTTDPSRIVHYEGVINNREFEDTISEVESRMYPTPQEIEAYLQNNPKKPYVLCEYMHCMGNSLGGMKSYMDLLDKYEMYHGGYIWDYADQALFVKDEVTGEKVLRYGGDFDDRPSDYEFSGNGIVFADRTEKPAMQEVKYYYGKYK